MSYFWTKEKESLAYFVHSITAGIDPLSQGQSGLCGHPLAESCDKLRLPMITGNCCAELVESGRPYVALGYSFNDILVHVSMALRVSGKEVQRDAAAMSQIKTHLFKQVL